MAVYSCVRIYNDTSIKSNQKHSFKHSEVVGDSRARAMRYNLRRTDQLRDSVLILDQERNF